MKNSGFLSPSPLPGFRLLWSQRRLCSPLLYLFPYVSILNTVISPSAHLRPQILTSQHEDKDFFSFANQKQTNKQKKRLLILVSLKHGKKGRKEKKETVLLTFQSLIQVKGLIDPADSRGPKAKSGPLPNPLASLTFFLFFHFLKIYF